MLNIDHFFMVRSVYKDYVLINEIVLISMFGLVNLINTLFINLLNKVKFYQGQMRKENTLSIICRVLYIK